MSNVLCDISESVRKMIHLNDKVNRSSYYYDLEKIMDCDKEADIRKVLDIRKKEKKELKKSLYDEINNFDKLVNIYFKTGGRWYNKVRVSYDDEYCTLVLKVKRPYNLFITIDDGEVKLLNKVISEVKFKEGIFIGELVYKPDLLDISL